MTDGTHASAYDVVFALGRRDPDRPCLVLDDARTLTYGEVDARAANLAGALAERGAGPGDRVVAQVDKSADAVALHLACLRSGLVHVPLNIAYTPSEVAFFVGDADATVFVGRPDSDRPALPVGCAAETLDGRGGGSLADAAQRAVPCTVTGPLDLSQPAAMLYTSGTTGRSKGAVLSGRNLVANARALVEAWRFRPDDVLLHVLPVFHVHGLFVALHCAFAVGAAVRFHERFEVGAVRRDLQRSTVLMGVPTHYHRLLADPDFGPGDCASMRLFTSGSAPLPAAEHERFTERTGHRIVERYGMTETMILTTNPYDGERVPGTVGFPLRGVELRVVDDGGRSTATGTPGSVEVRSDGVFLGYWRHPDKTAASFRDDGWFVTGDLGSLDTEGRLTLVGRASDLIISGGYNVYPAEVEAVLDSVDGVAETAVIGLPDPDLGESVVALVVVQRGRTVDDDELRTACRERLARFKHPQRFIRVDELPRNAMGKVQKAVLRQTVDLSGSSGSGGCDEDRA